MPEFEFTIGDDGDKESLFPDNDPLTFTFTDADGKRHVYRAADEGRAPDDRRVTMDSQPTSFMIEAIAGQAVEEQEQELKRLLWKLWEEGLLDTERVQQLIEFLVDERKKARKAQAKRKLHRPTTGPSVSTPS